MDEKSVKQTAEKLLSQLDIKSDVKVEITEDSYNLFLESEDNALIIGKHGNTLSSFELILALMLAKKQGEYKRVIIEVGGYRKEREEYLKQLAERLKESVVATGYEKTIRGLKPWERRLVHIFLKDDSDVATESTGEGNDRVLVIKKK
ncbi:MAG: hypothetical protein A2857_04335 [Candidatus Levybacteria bacterium RIFCSPHIGHO2_01_FULL_36_15]|nr:MAG: hypothetical protein A2857_04335 [Candidatus Levybacteria bacterium RIFCSPHIGHO2_01_FULL_36_15]OGH37316.1 MAG: hypothetical protein A2905_03615 [Candidatus Levybacteria bacterium RIFCSPLOWO2_01_FULL_36_10]